MKRYNIKLLTEIYITFFKIGCVSFGGGYAMIPLIEREITAKNWVEKEDFADIFTVSGSLPGAIGLNSSAFAGFAVAGKSGAVAALLGSLTPSVIIMLALSALYMKISALEVVKSAFKGIFPIIVGMILYAAFRIGKVSVKDIPTAILAFAAFILSLMFGLEPLPLILTGAVCGIIITRINLLLEAKRKLNESRKDDEIK